ncbi:hypothetical protein K5L01_10285 [Stenotrophomonas sp. CPCC 101365]|uniref:FAD-binding protein n=1 Tax=Stenotrophomonas mori TaxID=2871096 RepID=A0ABT0SIX1_9GAMM|nr:hypothetical protein [Stenotrophomonas mori]
MVLGMAPAAAGAGCLLPLLQSLGWQVRDADVRVPTVHGGTPCRRASLEAAWQHGDLQVRVPRGYDADRRDQVYRDLLEHPATLCAYAFVLGDATRRATARLQANSGYRFSALQLGWIGFGPRGAQAQGWQRFRSFGRGYAPAGGNTAAIEAFYSGWVRSECGVGRQVAQLATQRELYGEAGFDREFTAGELSIGTFLTLHDTPSILLGSNAGELFADGKAVRTSRLGRQAFVGVPGFIVHVFDKHYLDDINNQAENFVITEVSAEAADALARHGGLEHYDALNRRLWALSRQFPGSGRRRFERLLYARDPALRAAVPEAQRPLLAQMDAVLADPVYTGVHVYVHPKGVRPLGYHIARLLDRNPRTPYSIELGLHNLHTTLFRRWLRAQLRDCTASTSFIQPRGNVWNWA